MRQFILPEDWDGGPNCLIEGSRAHYVTRVLRLAPGATFPGRDRSGRLFSCVVRESSPGRVLLAVSSSPSPAPQEGEWRPPPRSLLAQALPKGTKMDLIVRQATEAGVAAVLPLVSERALRLGDEGAASRLSRWRRIVREARQQSGSGTSTEIAPPMSLAELPEALASRGVSGRDPKIVLHEAPLVQSSLHEYLTGAPDSVALCVGPEGGFARDEIEFLLAAGFLPLRLAGAVLRAETAALYAVAAAQIILSERSSWIPKSP